MTFSKTLWKVSLVIATKPFVDWVAKAAHDAAVIAAEKKLDENRF